MEPDRWRKIEALYEAALGVEAARRATFLEESCKGDESLRREVESLLFHDENAGGFLRVPALVKPLEGGQRVSRYEVQEKLGEGGMGAVYRAHDRQLRRPVALKVLPPEYAADPERRERLLREARAASALNHPNIVGIYEAGSDQGVSFIAMELVEGKTLQEAIPAKGLPLGKALDYAVQIAGALAKAHAAGVVHRDLKPGNVMVTGPASGHPGLVKLLDFGLARRVRLEPHESTLTAERGILGTPAYMSPEQASGQEVDRRSDIFSFGCVLYQMLTGRRPFEGDSQISVLAAILEKEPPPASEVAAGLPRELDRILARCLRKDPERRFQHMDDVRIALEEIRDESRTGGSVAARAESPRPAVARAIRVWQAVAGLCLIVAAAAVIALLGWVRTSQPAVATGEVTFSIPSPGGKDLGVVGGLSVDRISPDGSMILFRTADARFYIRRLISLESELLPAFTWFGAPFWAPDSQSIAFPTDHSRLMKMRIPKGAPELIVNDMTGGERGGSWGDKGIVLFSQADSSPGGNGLYSVPAAGGKALPVEVPGLLEGAFYNPEFLPGGEDFLFEFAPSDAEGGQVYMATLSGGKAVDPRLLIGSETAAAFTPAGGGRMLFVRNDNLYSQKLDRAARKLSGDPELLQERVASIAWPRIAYFSVSRTGTLVWRSGTALVSQVTVFDRAGNRTGIAATPAPVDIIRLSPDESHLIAQGEAGLWIVEADGLGQVRLNSAERLNPFWSPDGSRLLFTRGKKLLERSVSGSGPERELGEIPGIEGRIRLMGVSPDGRRFLLHEETGLSVFALDGKGLPERVVGQRADNAAMSPDGTWLVYHANAEPGVYVQPISGSSLPRRIAKSGASAVWRADGKEILYFDSSGPGIWSVPVEGSGEKLRFAAPERLFSAATPMGTASGSRPLAVNRDGSRIYFLQSTEQPESSVIHVRTNAIR